MGLNHIYKVIWSKTKNAWVVVSEIAKRDGKSSVKSVVTSVASKGIAATVVAMILCGGGITSAASFATPGATATGTDSVAVGDGVTATGEGGVAIGARTVAEKTTGNELYLQTGTGLKSSASGKKSLAIQGEATEENATAIQGVAKGQGAVAIGYSLSKGKRAVGLGWNSMALGDSSIAIGEASKATGENGIAVGLQAKVEADAANYPNGIAIGVQSHSIGSGIAVGYGSTANSYNLAFGQDSLALGDRSIALGSGARLNGRWSNAIGSTALAEGNRSSAIGDGYVLGDNSVSINSVVRGNSSIAINGSAGLIQFFDAATYYGTLLENANNGTVNKSVALGGDVTTDKTVRLGGSDYSFSNQGTHRLVSGSPVIRTDKNELITPTKIKAQFHGSKTDPIFPLAHATGGNVIGYVEGTLSNSIYLGYNSFAITDNVETDNETSSSGEKSLHTKSYDAAGHVVTSPNTTGGAFGLVSKTDIDDATFTNFAGGQSVGAVTIGGGGTERRIQNVAAGEMSATSTDAVNGSQLYSTAKTLLDRMTNYVHVNDGTATQKAGNATTNAGKPDEMGGATGTDSIAIGKNTKAEGAQSVSIGSAVKSTKDYALTIGSFTANNTGEYGLAIASGSMDLSGNSAIGIGAGSVSGDDAISIGTNYIAGSRNIGIGDDIETSASAEGSIILGNFSTATSKMATVIGNNSSAGYIFEQRVGAEGITTDNTNADNSVVIGNNLSATTKNTVIIGMNERKVGPNDRNQFVNPNKGTYTDNYGHPPVERYNEGTLENSVYLGHESYAFTDDATKDSPTSSSGEKSIHTKRYDTGTDTVITSTNTTGGAFGLVSKSTIDDTEFKNFAGEQSVGAVTIGGGGTERRIQNVAAGEMSATSTDAVNGSQLYSTAKTLLDGMTNYVHVNDGTTTQKAGTASSNKGILDAVGGATGKKSVAIGVDTQAAGENGVAVGNTAKATGKNSVAHGTDAEATEEDAIAIGNGAKAQGEKSISIGTGNIVKAAKSSVIGDPSYLDTSATGTHVQGNDNGTAAAPIMAKDSTFMGNNNLAGTAGTEGIHVVGNNNNIQSSNVMVLGNGITAGTGYDGAVILGNASVTSAYTAPTNTTINGVTLDASKYAGTTAAGSTLSQGSIVSVGDAGKERQIKNVAAGEISATSTDAVTGSQLYGAVKALTESSSSPDVYVHVNDGTTTQKAGNATTNAGKADEKGGATGKDSIAIGKNTKAEGIQSVSIGAAKSTKDYALTIGTLNTTNTAQYGLAIASGSMDLSGHSAIGIGAGRIAGNDAISIGGNYVLDQKNIVIGNDNETKVGSEGTIILGHSSSATAKNAIIVGHNSNAGYIYAERVNANGVTTDDTNAENSVVVGNNLDATAKNTVIIGSKDDRTFGDADKYVNPVKRTYTPSYGGPAQEGYAEGSLENSVYLGHESYAFTDDASKDSPTSSSGEKSIHTKRYDAATDTVITSTNTTGGAFGKVSTSTIEGVEFKNYAAEQSVGAVTIGGGGTERRIQNVAAGEVSATSTDAVNGSQLHSVAKTILTTPLKMAGDSGDTVGLKLGKTVNIKGSVTSGADVTDGNIAVVGDSASNTLNLKMAKNLTGLTSGTFTDATGNQTVINGAGVTVTPTGTGAIPISLTTSGINAGNKEIKGVAKGTTDDAAVNKKQMEDALAGISSTLTINDGTTDGSVNLKTGKLKVVGESGTDALVTTTVSGDTITVGTSTKLQNAVTAAEKSADKDLSNLSSTGSNKVKTLAQDAVKVDGTGLATVSNSTDASGNKTYTVNVDEGKLVIDDTTGKVGATGATQGTIAGKDGVATTKNVADVVNSAIDKTTQALADAKHNFAGDDTTVISRKHGEQLNIKGGASTTTTDLTSGNIAVVGDTTSGTLNIKMAKALTGLTSATYTDAAGNTQTVTGGSSTISDAAGNSTVVSKGGVTTTDAAGNTTTTAPTGVTVTPAGTGATPISVTTSGINAGNKEIKGVAKGTTDDAAVNKKQMDDAIKTGSTWKVSTNTGGTTDVTGGDTVDFINGDNISITNTGRNITIATARNVAFDKVTVGGTSGIVIDGTTKQIGGLVAATSNDQAVNKGQMDAAVAGALSTETVEAATAAAGDTNLVTVTPKNGVAKNETYAVGVSGNAVKSLATQAAQDAVKVAGTGLATVSDATAAGVKTYTVNVDEGKLVIDDTTGKLGATGATQGTTAGKDGVATTQNVASVVNSAIDKTKQALDDAKHNFAGDDATVISRKHGEQLNIKGGASTTASDLTSGNIAVVGDTTSGTLNIKMAKALTGLTSATYTDAAGNTQTVTGGSSTISDAAGNSTVVSKGGVTTTDAAGNTTTTAPTGVTVTPAGTGATPISVTTSGINAGNKEIKGVAKGTTDDAAVNKKQMDDALKGATDNTVSLGSESGSTTAKKLSTTGGITFNIKGETGANALITTSATGDDVTIAPTAKLTAAVTAAEKSADKDLSNLSAAGDSYIKNLAKSAASWNVETNGSGATAVAGGETVNFINGDNIAITNAGRSITIGTAKNVSFDKVTVGGTSGIVIDGTAKQIGGLVAATANDQAVNKGQMDTAIANAQTAATSTEKVVAKTLTGDTNLATVTGQTGTAKGETYEVAVSENAVKSVAQTAAQDAVKVAGTGLATVSDTTAAGVKTYTVNVDEGKLVIDDTTGKLGATGASQGATQGKDGVATTKNVADVVNSAIDKTKQALDDAKHNFAGDDATVISRKHGEQLNIKGGASTTTTDLTSGNIAVVGDTTSGTLNIKMAKALTGLTSATYTDAAGNTQTVTGGSSTISDAAGNSTVVSKGGVTTTDAAGNTTTTAPTGVTVTPTGAGATPISVTTSGISAGNKEIKNVANGTTDDAAVNKKQMDDALKGATDNTVSLGSESGTTTAKKLSTTGGITFNIKGETGANALITTSASGDDVTIAPTAKLTAAVTAAEKSADKDLSNLSAAGDSYIKNLAKSAASWNVETNGAGTTAVAGGDTVNFINGDNIAITNTGRSITIGTAKNVSFDKVTVGGIVLDKTDGINAGNKEIKGVATGTAADSAVNKAQMDAAITAAASGSLSTETVEAGSTANGKLATGDTNLATVSGLTGTAKGETYAVTVSGNAVKAVAQTAAQDAVKVAGTGLATVSDATAAGVKTYTVNVDEGKLVIDDTTGKLGATGATQGATQGKNGVATTQDVATVVNSAIDKTKQALDDAKHNFAGDDATVISRKHGEQLNIKGGASTAATDLTSGNIAVVGDTTSGTLNIKLAKVLTGLTSATYTDAAGNTQTVTGGSSTITDGAGNTTTITKGGVTTTDGTNTTTVAPSGITATDGTHTVTLGGSGINAGGTEIKNIGKATTDDAAVNKKQMDDAVKAATDSVSTLGDNKVSLGSDAGTTTAKKLSTTGGIKFNIKGDTGTNALITTSATGDDVTIAPTAKLTAAVMAAENAANKDLSNLNAAGDTYIKNLAKSAASWNVETNGTGTTAVAGGDTVNFINGDNIAITNTGRSITIGTTKNVSFDRVTVGGIVLDKNTGIDAGGKEITNVGPATSGNSAVNKTQMDTAIANVQTAATSTEKVVAKTLTGDTNLATVTGRTGTAKGETYEVAVSENAVKAVAQTAAQDAVKVTGTGLATVTDSTTGGVKTYNVDVKTGNLVVNAAGQAGAAGTTGAGGASGADGVATTQNVASAINDAITKSKADTTQALADAEHKFDGDTGTTSVRKHGEVLSIKGGVTTPADLTTGNLGVVSDGAGTLNIRLAKVLSGLTSASFTTAGGDTTMINGGGVTITPSAAGATPISITTAGINAGNKEIKGIANGTTADAAVNKGQLDAAVLAAAGGSLSTEKVVAKTLTGDTNLVTVTGQTGTAKGETYEVAVSENAVKAVAQTAAQDAVKVTGTGLATVTDSTTGGVKTYNVDVTTGNLVVTATGQVGAAGTTGASGASGTNGVATTQNVASAINAAITKSNANTAQALADAEHKFDGDTGTTSVRKHGEVLSIKGGVTTPADLTTGNIGVVSDGAGTLNVRLAKTLTGLTSASFTDGTHTVTIGGSGINAGGTEIKNIGKATTDDAAVNKKQMDDAVKAATDSVTTLGDNKVSLGSDSGTTTAKKLSTTGGIKFNIKGDTGANALITTSATGDDVTIAPTAKLSAAVTAAENAANKDLSNLSATGDTYIKNLAKTAASWNVETNGTGTTAVAGGDTVNFINGDNIAITNTGRSITIGTTKNVSFDRVTVGGIVLDKNTGIDAGGKEITNVGPATSGNSAVNKTQMDTAITNAVNKATTDAKHDFGGDDTTVVTRKHGEKLNIKGGASTTAADLTSGNIAVLGDAATGTLNIRMAKALTGLSSATFTTSSGTTVINGGGMTITPSATGAAPISITTNGINAGNTEIKNVAAGTTANSAVNKQQMDSAISNATANVGFHTAGNTGTGSVSNGQTLTITGTNGIETNASGQSITVGLDAATRAQINNATTTANNAAKKDLSNIDNTGKQMIKDTAAWNVKVNGATAETVKGGDTVTFNDGDNIKVTNTGKDITIATKKDVSFDKVTVGNVVIDKNTNRISGLANAVNNDEAVNLGQMNAAISTVTAGTNTIKYKANSGTQNSVALTTGFDFKGDSNIQITADPANSGVVNYKLNPALTGITSISGGTGAPTITLNAGSGSTPGNVSINSNLDMGGKQINNIGAATHAGDAVNKAQMDQALQNIAGASSNVAKSYAYKAGAGAAALAALKPIQYDPLEPTQIMAGIGNYKSQTAVALGVAHYTNENTMFNFGVSLDSHDGIVNAGVTHKFGYSPEKKAIPDRYKGGPISSIYVMQDEVTALQAIVQKQAAENEALRQQNEDMQRKVDMILSKIH